MRRFSLRGSRGLRAGDSADPHKFFRRAPADFGVDVYRNSLTPMLCEILRTDLLLPLA
jgi:hypothetical protein